ncbi:Uma2 family endonuclease [Jeongeupella avenae]|uniref:Uma2 family endonuclease n=1 Tax=Antarcticirhabdus aurantiaca TaxID=2606717 RepID=A0ACD4NXN4_9HYPH|nr:Uma2 family endonuclease [Antarcticirhabdus aurantiaca]WAJ31478.1 Uma2 family endonuclease [Jeongeuplla avenae]
MTAPSDPLLFTPATTFRLSDDTFLEPDFVVYDRAIGLEGLTAATCRLAIEVSDSSLAYDLGRKATIYAAFGVGELWVIDALRLSTRIHRRPSPTCYQLVRDERAEAELAAERIEAFQLRLSDHM